MEQFKLAATAVYPMGNGSAYQVSRIVFQVIGTTWTGSAVIKGRVYGANIADADLKSLPYVNLATGAMVAAATAITGDGIFAVQADGLEVVLDYTHTSGSAQVSFVPLEGPGTVLA